MCKHMPDFVGFQYKVILDLYRRLFHAVVIYGPEHDFLFKSASTFCAGRLKEDGRKLVHEKIYLLEKNWL